MPPATRALRAWRAVASVDGGLAAQVAAGEYWGHGSLFGVQSLGGGEFYWYAASAGAEAEDEAETARTDLLRRFGHGPTLCRRSSRRRTGRSSATTSTTAACRTAWHSDAWRWSGDAAHPMVPSLGQGACQAVADGEAVADALAQAPDPAAGLRLYSDRRRPAARWR